MDILNGTKNGRLFTYVDGINPHDLPRTLRGVQSFNTHKDKVSDLVSVINNAIRDITYKHPSGLISGNSKDNIPRITESEITRGDVLDFSCSFLSLDMRELEKYNVEEIEQRIRKIGELYNYIHFVEYGSERVESKSIVETMQEIVQHGCKSRSKNILKIKGPLGAYKSGLLQCFYMLIEKKDKGILPFYIDVSKYERMAVVDNGNGSIDYRARINNDIEFIKKACSNFSDITPLLILDGVRDFSYGKDEVYASLKKHLSSVKCKTIVSLDTGFSKNPKRLFGLHPLAGNNYDYYIKITSMNVNTKKECVDYIGACLDLFEIAMPYTRDEKNDIYNAIVRMNISKLDAGWLATLLKEMPGNLLNKELTIADFYYAICQNVLEDESINDAARLAYEFEYGDTDFIESELKFDSKWNLITKNRSVLDYLIAYHYVQKFSEMDLLHDENISEKLHFFSMVLPKTVTVFVAAMFNKKEEHEEKVLSIAKKFYYGMPTFEKNELIFLLGRIKNIVRKHESSKLLKEYEAAQRDIYAKSNNQDINTRKKQAFLLRTLSVSLIVLNDKKVANNYFKLLLTDKLTNEINRGFHLEYYGDKPYIPNLSKLDFTDILSKGENTFDSLFTALKNKVNHNLFSYMAVLELMTICSLIQARIEGKSNGEKVFLHDSYLTQALKCLEWMLSHKRINEFEIVKLYFEWMRNELNKYETDQRKYSQSSIFNELSLASQIKRTGWELRGVTNPENIVEHMYNCWLLAALYLPEKSEDSRYCKTTIMNILLIHDIGEVKTGDIPKSEKKKRQEHYDSEENRAVYDFVFSGTYPNSENATWLKTYWDNWYYDKDINYEIAKDIDTIQAIYQFCIYYLKDPSLFDYDDAKDWMDGQYELNTFEGQVVFRRVVLDNPLFEGIIKEFC